MLRMRIVINLAFMVAAQAACADEPAPSAPLTDASVFERAYGSSFYGFDACGDALTGSQFRNVLIDKFAQCPFTAEARKQFAEWTKAQTRKSGEVIQAMIAERGGLPVRLSGMATTCHDRFLSPDYQQLRANLDRYQQGQAATSAILPGACNATEIRP